MRDKDNAHLAKKLYEDGYTVPAIACMLDVSKATVYYHLREIRAQERHREHSERCMACEYNHIDHGWCMKKAEEWGYVYSV